MSRLRSLRLSQSLRFLESLRSIPNLRLQLGIHPQPALHSPATRILHHRTSLSQRRSSTLYRKLTARLFIILREKHLDTP
jgi:hypothetical protein